MRLHNLFLLSFAFFTAIATNHVRALEGESIIGGDTAKLGELPYQVFLSIESNGYETFNCGGAIIDNYHVVTAAHCVVATDRKWRKWRDLQEIVVKAGIIDSKMDVIQDPFIMKEIRVHSVFVPAEYFRVPVPPVLDIADIAILKLKQSLNLGNNPVVGQVKIPPNNAGLFVGEMAKVSGFGHTHMETAKNDKGEEYELNGYSDDKLHLAFAKVVNHDECQRAHDDVVLNPSSHLCAQVVQNEVLGIKGQGVCAGDSGGPLVFNDMLIGVVSASPTGCTEAKQPAIYTRVSTFFDFIVNVVYGNFDNRIAYTILPPSVNYNMVTHR